MPDIDESVLITPAEPLPKPPGVHERLPPKPGLRGLLPTVRRQYNQRVHAAMRAAEADFARYREEEARRKENAEQAGKLRIAQAAWDSVSEQHAEIDRYALAVRGGDPYSVCRYFHQKISAVVADDPPELITHFQPGYEPDNRVLKLRYELPEPAVVPTHDVVTAEGMTPVFQSLPAEEHEHLYLELICRIALRALRTAFGTDPADLVETVLFNGVVSTVEETELVPEQVCVLSVAVTAVRFAEIDLASVNPVAAVETDFAGNLTSNVATLSPVPLVRLNGSLIRTTPVDRVVPEPS
jgi:restriction system protein